MKPTNNIKKIAVGIVIITATIFTFVGVLSIWDLFSDDALWKSLSTLGVVAFGALVVAVASEHMIDKNPQQQTTTTVATTSYAPSPNYTPNAPMPTMNQGSVPPMPVNAQYAPQQHTVPVYGQQQSQ